MLRESRAIWATLICFLISASAGAFVLWGGAPRPIVGERSIGLPAAIVGGLVAAGAFLISSFLHRRGETAAMPRWQVLVSAFSSLALTIAFAGVTAFGVLVAGEVLGVGLHGLQLPPLGGGIVIGIAGAIGGRLAFEAGTGLSTGDLANLLFSYLVLGTLFAMLTAADPAWWHLNFSQLGIGDDAWVFNGTLIVGGLLIATVGFYIGRDLHRLRGDGWFGRIVAVVLLWAATGVALAEVGLFPLERNLLIHNIAAVSTLVLFIAAGTVTTFMMPGPPKPLVVTSAGTVVLLVVAFVLTDRFHIFSLTVLEAIVIGMGLLWLTTLVRILAVLAPVDARPAERGLLHA